MVEKFSDYESTMYLSEPGTYIFTVKNAELKDSKNGNLMVEVTCSCDDGELRSWFSLSPKARFKYNNFIAACLKLTREQRRCYELDYETIHNELIGKKFIGTVEEDTYEKPIKAMTEDGRFEERIEEKHVLRIARFDPFEG